MTTASYDTIGQGYTDHRRPDPRVAAQITAALAGAPRVVNVGAGAGSYEPAEGVVAVDLSLLMLRQRGAGSSPAVRATAEALPFPDASFDAALSVLSIHHWDDWRRGVDELRRVAARQVILTFEREGHEHFWLVRDYFPAITDLVRRTAPAPADIAAALGGARVEPVLVPRDCVDGFLCAYWCRPAAYLDPGVRAAISGFQLLDVDLEPGLNRLRADLASGAWARRNAGVLDQDHFDGGYRLIVAD